MSSFRDDAAAAVEWAARYLEGVRDLPVLARVEPGDQVQGRGVQDARGLIRPCLLPHLDLPLRHCPLHRRASCA